MIVPFYHAVLHPAAFHADPFTRIPFRGLSVSRGPIVQAAACSAFTLWMAIRPSLTSNKVIIPYFPLLRKEYPQPQ